MLKGHGINHRDVDLAEWPFFPNPLKGGMYVTIRGDDPNERTITGSARNRASLFR